MNTPTPFTAERWYIDNEGEKQFENQKFSSRNTATEWLALRGYGETLESIVRTEGFKVKRVYIDWTGFNNTDAIIVVDGIGELTIEAELPARLKNQIEQFFMDVAYARIRSKATVALNPATPGFPGGEAA